ncbi:MAG TPA: methionyl-tRNA formyltransferase, partial [Pyrinomonadaceae bacterium]|nr:methionyl-tRNA formyltransferase [Pyrinomonadaceae bacterium]
MAEMLRSVLLFGDTIGIPQLLRVVPAGLSCGIVVAEIRPEQHEPLREIADEQQLPLLIQPRKTSEHYAPFVEQVRELSPDLILVNSYSMLLRDEVLAVPPFGAVNVHGALLPQYRGSNPMQWALINNETETGVTMHYMDSNFDTGDIIAQRRVPIFFEDTWLSVRDRIGEATEAMLAEEMPRLLSRTNTRTPQDEKLARHHRRRRPEDGLVDWRQSALSIYNLVRALVRPLPGAFYYSGADKIVLDEYLFMSEVVAL